MPRRKRGYYRGTKAIRKEILVLLAKHHMNVSEVARIMCYSRNTVVYHVAQIKKETGKNPLNLLDLAYLLGWSEVVRCKDCIYWPDNNGGYPHDECRWGKHETPDDDDFCSYGERRKQ